MRIAQLQQQVKQLDLAAGSGEEPAAPVDVDKEPPKDQSPVRNAAEPLCAPLSAALSVIDGTHSRVVMAPQPMEQPNPDLKSQVCLPQLVLSFVRRRSEC